jgi:transposase
MRLRPVNFPTIRIAQFASLIFKSETLFSKILESNDLEKIKKLFNIAASEYWDNHYRFNKTSKKQKKELGESSINTLIINVVIPFLFVYGEYQSTNLLKDRALDFLEKLPPEKNSIIANWQKLGIKVQSAFETQALLQLKNLYCEQKKCLNCQIGNKLVKI